jgi:hypothetical protein
MAGGEIMTDRQKIEQLFDTTQYMILAVTLDDATPWAVPVKIQAHEGCKTLEWDSRLDTVHSQAVAARPQMAITVFQKHETGQVGLYMKGTGELLEKRSEDFGRYRFTTNEAWLNDETFVKRQVELG